MPVPKGTRYGGKPKGFKATHTLEKEAQRELVRQLVGQQLTPMVQAQIRHAIGVGHLMLRDEETQRFERVVTTGDPLKDEAVIDAAVSTGRACWIYLKDPSVQAFSDLLNRALDKPKEQAQEINLKGTINIPELLRQRYAKRKKVE